DRLSQQGPEVKSLHGRRPLSGSLAHMTSRTVNSLKQRKKTPPENPVILGTAQPAACPKFHKLDTAIRANQLGELADQLANVRHDQIVDNGIKRQVWGRFRQDQPCLPRTAHTKVELLSLAANLLGQMHRRLALASLTDHGPTTSEMGTRRTRRAAC